MDPKKLVLTLILTIGLLGLTVNLLTSRSPLSPATVDLYEYEHTEFLAFQKNFNKSYSDNQEYTKRFSIFRDNLAFINQHNAGSHTFTVGINQFADLTNEEFRAIYTKTMPKVNRDKNYVNLKENDLPDSIDWRQKGIVTPVKDQGQCGSCWAFSTTGAIEGAYAQKTGKLVAFSEQQLVDCSGSFGNHGCSGGLMDQAFSYLEQNALETEEDYNYTGVQGTCHYVAPDGKVKVANFVDVEPNNELALKAAVAERVVSVAVDAGDMGWQFYNGGVFGWPCGTELDHGVLAVGYGTEDYIEYWLVKNSWGSSWGEQGYIKIPRGDKAGEPGKCGIAINPSYPILA